MNLWVTCDFLLMLKVVMSIVEGKGVFEAIRNPNAEKYQPSYFCAYQPTILKYEEMKRFLCIYLKTLVINLETLFLMHPTALKMKFRYGIKRHNKIYGQLSWTYLLLRSNLTDVLVVFVFRLLVAEHVSIELRFCLSTFRIRSDCLAVSSSFTCSLYGSTITPFFLQISWGIGRPKIMDLFAVSSGILNLKI